MAAYWQVMAGSFGRALTPIFVKFGMACVGGEDPIAKMGYIKVGDIVVLKSGQRMLEAVGEVVERNGISGGNGDKDWLDFDGWYMPAYRYVDWHVPTEPLDVRETTGHSFTRDTIDRIKQDSHMELANTLLQLPVYPSISEPPPTNPVADEDFSRFFVSEGLTASSAYDATNQIRELRSTAENYYYNFKPEDVREHLTRQFLIVPLLLALGWSPQQIQIEYPSKGGRLDIACFSKAFNRNDRDCVLIVEAKGFAQGLDYAADQAHAYAKGFPSCEVIVISNGYCYKTYKRHESGEFASTPSAFLNLLKPRNRYPIDPENVDGATGVLKWLLPVNLM